MCYFVLLCTLTTYIKHHINSYQFYYYVLIIFKHYYDYVL